MKLSAHFATWGRPRRASLRSLRRLGYAALLLASAGCKQKPEPSSPALTHTAEAAGSVTSGAAPGAMPTGHPGITSPVADKMDEAETAALAAAQKRKEDAEAAAAAAPKVPWAESCQAHQKCAVPPPIPDCKENVVAHNWDELEYNAARAAGQTIDVEGPLALSPLHAVSNQKCPPGVCCHKLDMNVVLDGRPDALALPGFTCHGDDSGMCCNVPANGQLVTATGVLKKAPPGSPLKWQLVKASFCIGKITQPAKPSMGPGQ